MFTLNEILGKYTDFKPAGYNECNALVGQLAQCIMHISYLYLSCCRSMSAQKIRYFDAGLFKIVKVASSLLIEETAQKKSREKRISCSNLHVPRNGALILTSRPGPKIVDTSAWVPHQKYMPNFRSRPPAPSQRAHAFSPSPKSRTSPGQPRLLFLRLPVKKTILYLTFR